MQYQYAPQQLGGGFQQQGFQGFQGAQGVQGFAARGQPFAPAGYSVAPPTTVAQAAPLTPKIAGPMTPGAQAMVPQQMMGSNMLQQQRPVAYQDNNMAQQQYMRGGGREQALEQRVRELESLLINKEKKIQELQTEVSILSGKKSPGNSKVRSPGRGGSGFRKVAESKPVIRYSAADQDDPIDVRLEEFYNSTGSAIQFWRINRGFYRFGDTIVQLDIINHKLMASTEDGWNRGKMGPIEKFLMYYENIEREKAGILPEA